MSAIAEDVGGPDQVIQVLIAVHPGFNALDVVGPLEVLTSTRHRISDPSTKAFEVALAAEASAVTSTSNLTIRATVDYEDAHDELEKFDVLLIPGGGDLTKILADSDTDDDPEPIGLIKAYAALQTKDPSKERTLMSVDTGSLILAKAGVLQGLSATTHPDYYTKMEIICKEAARKGDLSQTDVMEERYVVNNARYDLGEKFEENPFILTKRPDGRRKSIARKGSDAYKLARRRESIVKRANLRLGGLRVITSGGVTSGIDASLYLVAALVSHDSALEVARLLQFNWTKGVTVEGIDV